MKSQKRKQKIRHIRRQQKMFRKAKKERLEVASSPAKLLAAVEYSIAKIRICIISDERKMAKIKWRMTLFILGLLVSVALEWQCGGKSWLVFMAIGYFAFRTWTSIVAWIITRSSLKSWKRLLQEDSESFDSLQQKSPRCGCCDFCCEPWCWIT